MFNKENAIEFRKFIKKEGGAESFKRNFIRDPLHSSNNEHRSSDSFP